MIRAYLKALFIVLVAFVLTTATIWEITSRTRDPRDFIGVGVTTAAAIAANIDAGISIAAVFQLHRRRRCATRETS